MKTFLLIFVAGSCAASILGPIEPLQESDEELFSEEIAGVQAVMDVGRLVKLSMHSFLENQTRELESRIKGYIEDTCRPATTDSTGQGNAQVVDLEGKVSRAIGDFLIKMSSAIQSFVNELQMKFEAKIGSALRKPQEKVQEEKVRDVPKLPPGTFIRTKHNGDSYTKKLVTKAVQNQVKYLASRSDLQKQTEHFDRQLGNIQSQQESLIDQKILNYTKEIHRILFSFKPIYETFQQVVNTCNFREEQLYQMERFKQLLQDPSAGMEENEDILSNMYSEDFEGEMPKDTQSQNSDSGATLVQFDDDNSNQNIPIGAMNECIDSEFVGIRLDTRVCENTVIRYNMCHNEVAAYHCCRSCTDAGLIPEVGPHRFLNLPRRVSLHNALK